MKEGRQKLFFVQKSFCFVLFFYPFLIYLGHLSAFFMMRSIWCFGFGCLYDISYDVTLAFFWLVLLLSFSLCFWIVRFVCVLNDVWCIICAWCFTIGIISLPCVLYVHQGIYYVCWFIFWCMVFGSVFFFTCLLFSGRIKPFFYVWCIRRCKTLSQL